MMASEPAMAGISALAEIDRSDSDAAERLLLQFERSVLQLSDSEIVTLIASAPLDIQEWLTTEFACIEIERNFADYHIDTPSRFIALFQSNFSKPKWREAIALEHFRTAMHCQASVSIEKIAALYSITEWSTQTASDLQALAMQGQSSVALVTRTSSEPIRFPKPGDTFASYRLVALLGRGALGQVYLARQPDLAERLVVIKITTVPGHESDRLAQLQHTNIIPVYSIHTEKGLFGICMPFLGAFTYSDVIREWDTENSAPLDEQAWLSTLVERRLSTIVIADADEVSLHTDSTIEGDKTTIGKDQVCSLLDCEKLCNSWQARRLGFGRIEAATKIAQGIVDGLAYTHSKGIVHADIKPENVLISNDGVPILLDFNLSRSTIGNRTRILGGTLPYMSPQQMRSLQTGGEVAPSDDVFSIGVLLYQSLTGKLPFSSSPSISNLSSLADKRSKEKPTSLREINPSISSDMQEIVYKSLAPSLNDRYPSAVELQEDLQRHRLNLPLKHARNRSPKERIQKFVRRHPLVTSNAFLAIAATIAIVLLVLSIISVSRKSRVNATMVEANELTSQSSLILSKIHSPNRDPQIVMEGVEEGSRLLKSWNTDEIGSLTTKLSLLPTHRHESVKSQLGYLAFAVAGGETNLSLSTPSEKEKLLASAERWRNRAVLVAPALQGSIALQRRQIEAFNESSSADVDESKIDSKLGKQMLARETRDYSKWTKFADELVTENPTDPWTWFNLGSAYFSTGSYRQSFHCYDTAVRLQPKDLQSVFWRGVSALQLNDLEQARTDFTVCLKEKPAWIAARFNLALALFQQGSLNEAKANLDELEARKTISNRAYMMRSRIYQALGNRKAAEIDLKMAQTCSSRDADDWCTKGLLLVELDSKEAEECFEQSIRMDPTNLTALQNSAHVLSEKLNQIPKSIERMDRIVELQWNDASAWATRGILEARIQNWKDALQDASKADSLAPSPTVHLQIAGILALSLDDEATSSDGMEREYKSLMHLGKALAIEPTLYELVESDPDTSNLRSHDRYRELVGAAKQFVTTYQQDSIMNR